MSRSTLCKVVPFVLLAFLLTACETVKDNPKAMLGGATGAAAGGLIGFIALALRLPGSSWWLDNTTSWASGAIALTGAAISLALVSLYNSITYNE